LLFASKSPWSLWTIFFAAASALVITSAIGLAVGTALSEVVNPRYLSYTAGVGFIAIGVWTLYQAGGSSS
jgi:putative Ca2+/H+ antiporter (TMEM165/GDT1 family)